MLLYEDKVGYEIHHKNDSNLLHPAFIFFGLFQRVHAQTAGVGALTGTLADSSGSACRARLCRTARRPSPGCRRATRLRTWRSHRPARTAPWSAVLLAGSVAWTAPPDGASLEWHLPPGFHAPRVPLDNPMSEAKVQLGRRLFYDHRMSIDGKGGCSTCHLQELGFADRKDKNVAVGLTGEKPPRRAVPLANIGYFAALTWANPTRKVLETQARTPLFGAHPVELDLPEGGEPFLRIVGSDAVYRKMFPEAFPGDPGPYTFDHVTCALACFERTLISGRSPYDRYRYQNDENAISESAKRGESLFFHQPTICLPCPGGITFGGGAVQAHTHDPKDIGKFHPPSLRNVAVRAPYMHDGSIATLDGVLDHYSAGGRTARRSDRFLESLTDSEFLHDPRFGDPWNR